MTDPAGVSFVSYRRTRSDEVALLVQAHHDHGVPTWRDVDDLRHEPTDEELKRVLRDPRTANALLWVTDDVKGSAVIPKTEVPIIHERKRTSDGFFVVPVAAGCTDYREAAEIVSTHLDMDDFRTWNFEKVDGDPITDEEAAEIAQAILRRRLETIDDRIAGGEPFTLGLFTRTRAPARSGFHLALDWCPRFTGRVAPARTWKRYLLPAMAAVVDALHHQNASRPVRACGQAAIPALLALGAAFLEPRGQRLIWEQRIDDRDERQEWDLCASSDASPISVEAKDSVTAAVDLGVFVSIRADVEAAVKLGQQAGKIPDFRAYVRIRGDDRGPVVLATPGQAAYAVRQTVEGIRRAQHEFCDGGKIHLFVAAPAGYAVMLGQKLNGLGPVQTYEHQQTDRIGRYRRAVLLTPGA